MWKEHVLELAAQLTHVAWGASHSRRVYESALFLARQEGWPVDPELLWAAGYLHDVGALERYRLAGIDHADRSVQVAGDVLAVAGFPEEKIARVQEIVRGHMFYREPAAAPEAVVFHDADTLDFLGFIGITRLLAIVGLDDWAPDMRAAVDRIVQFSGELPARLHTPHARQLGEARQAEMHAYLAGLAEETHHLMEL
jgi:uncharacterized protein